MIFTLYELCARLFSLELPQFKWDSQIMTRTCVTQQIDSLNNNFYAKRAAIISEKKNDKKVPESQSVTSVICNIPK